MLDAATMRETPLVPTVLVVPPIVDSPPNQVSTLTSHIAPLFDLFLNFSLDDFMMGVLFHQSLNGRRLNQHQ